VVTTPPFSLKTSRARQQSTGSFLSQAELAPRKSRRTSLAARSSPCTSMTTTRTLDSKEIEETLKGGSRLKASPPCYIPPLRTLPDHANRLACRAVPCGIVFARVLTSDMLDFDGFTRQKVNEAYILQFSGRQILSSRLRATSLAASQIQKRPVFFRRQKLGSLLRATCAVRATARSLSILPVNTFSTTTGHREQPDVFLH
jgi:hypothetical protein